MLELFIKNPLLSVAERRRIVAEGRDPSGDGLHSREGLFVRSGLAPVGRRFGALARVALSDICSPRPASGRGAGGEG